MDYTESIAEFLERVDNILYSKKIPKETFYEDTGISRGTWYYWKKGKTSPNNSTIVRIAEYLGVSPDYLRFGITPADKMKEAATIGDLSLDEILILSLYRQCSVAEKESIGAFLTQLRSAPAPTPGETEGKE